MKGWFKLADNNVRFVRVSLQAKYDALVTKDTRALYWVEDTQRLYSGEVLYGTGAEASEVAAGLLSAEDYAALKRLIAAGPASALEPVDGSVVIADGKIGIGLSTAGGNLLSVKDDGLFATIDLTPIEGRLDAVEGRIDSTEARLTKVEKDVVELKEAAADGIHYRGSVATKNDLPTDAKQGDLYECIDTGVEYCWNGKEWFEYGSAHFVPVAGAGIDVTDSTISAKLSPVAGNALRIIDGGLFAPECDFTDKDRVVIDTLSMLYATKTEMDDAIARSIADNRMMWEDIDSEVVAARIGDTYYPTVKAAIAAAKDGDTIHVSAGTYNMIEFTKSTASNLTIVGNDDVYVGKVRLTETTNYSAPNGLKLKGIIFNGEGIAAVDDEINNLSVVDCTFTNGAVIHVNGTCVTNGLVVDGCTFEATNSAVNNKEKTAILIQGISKNVVIRDNKIDNCEHNAIQVVGASGSMFIDANTMSNTGSRAMRITTKDGATLAITNNIIANVNTNAAEAAENNGEIIKITGVVTDGVTTGNTYGGSAIDFNGGIGKVV